MSLTVLPTLPGASRNEPRAAMTECGKCPFNHGAARFVCQVVSASEEAMEPDRFNLKP